MAYKLLTAIARHARGNDMGCSISALRFALRGNAREHFRRA